MDPKTWKWKWEGGKLHVLPKGKGTRAEVFSPQGFSLQDLQEFAGALERAREAFTMLGEALQAFRSGKAPSYQDAGDQIQTILRERQRMAGVCEERGLFFCNFFDRPEQLRLFLRTDSVRLMTVLTDILPRLEELLLQKKEA